MSWGLRATTFPWKHTQEKALSPASSHGVDLGGTSATRGESQGSFGRGELKTLNVSARVGGFLIFLSLPFKQSKILLSVVEQILKV